MRRFEAAIAIDWTPDPFDRLIVADARGRRWRPATGDDPLVARLGACESGLVMTNAPVD